MVFCSPGKLQGFQLFPTDPGVAVTGAIVYQEVSHPAQLFQAPRKRSKHYRSPPLVGQWDIFPITIEKTIADKLWSKTA